MSAHPPEIKPLSKKRRMVGTVVSDKMQKTVVVQVDMHKVHKKYHRSYRARRRFKAHDEKGEYKVGGSVIIEETRPLSRDKRWRVVGKA